LDFFLCPCWSPLFLADGGGGGGAKALLIFLCLRIEFFCLMRWRGAYKKQKCFKRLFGLCDDSKNEKSALYGKQKRGISVTRLQRKRGTVQSNTHTRPMLLGKLRLWAQIFYSAPYSNKPSAHIPHSVCKTKFHAHKTNRHNWSHSQQSFYTAFYRIFTANTLVVEDLLKTWNPYCL